MRKKSGNYQDLYWSALSKNQHQQIQQIFKRTEQRNGGISFYDMINIFRSIGFSISQQEKDQINKKLAEKEIRVLDINNVTTQAAMLKKERQQNKKVQDHENKQYLDAYIALGGSPDKTGVVRKNVLIQTLKRQFQLTVDLETLIQNSESLDYETFCSIFQKDKQAGERLNSACSEQSLRTQLSVKSVVIDDRDFQKFLSMYDDQ